MTADFSKGAAFSDGKFVPAGEAAISVLDWGFTRSDVTYDVVHVRDGAFFRLQDHLDRFEHSLKGLRLSPSYSMAEIGEIAMRCVALSGLRDSYVAMICTRGRPRIFGSRRPQDCDNKLIVYAIPWIDVIPLEVQERGAHLHIASVPRIAPASIDPTIKNYHWGDLTRGLFEAHDAGADTAVLLDAEGFVTEGPGFNVFIVKDGEVLTPDRGVLEGITRRSVLELCGMLGIPARIAPLTSDDLASADEMFCTTTAGGVMPVSRIGDHIMGDGRPGGVSLRLKSSYWEQHKAGWHQTPVDYSIKTTSFEGERK
ncbi:branched-chain amino acid--2-keto-4-methylthiobutyrate aminotransferase [Rhizobium leguminosarum]|uniref:aminotransferase class IV n=1 Tax=Rhizobium leguminosarum TaxID=384 RepID=UPI0013B60055|nr:aminotransferase class IV [Rhizobium leguminosarum]NEI59358.1 branched-chain amino acid--2-keto-4-methylthiobutyrate aminotransferase [Rhizobium leguminosarum]NEI88198.1 branched-chain amino acid--2-keto-4-methylthiobutyrate aminotransferase [Rhizobium leguminosarum]